MFTQKPVQLKKKIAACYQNSASPKALKSPMPYFFLQDDKS